MYGRGRPFTAFVANKLVELTNWLFRNTIRPRKKRLLLMSVLGTVCLLVLFVNTYSVWTITIPCTYLDPCREDTYINFLGNTTLPHDMCPICKEQRDWLVQVDETVTPLDHVERQLQWLQPGGRHEPSDCVSRQRVAIVIPYRNRQEHLQVFLKNIHPFLRNQYIHYGIFVVEQSEGSKFNRGSLLNIGFVTALQEEPYNCFIFHDVDYIPLDLRNLYSCSPKPKHMSAIVDTFDNTLPYQGFFGGVAALTTKQFRRINGFPNRYWGWGGEDDDIVERFKEENYTIVRHSIDIAKYTMLEHTRDRGNPVNPERYKLLYDAHKQYLRDGLNNLKYRIKKLERKKLYTRIYVDLFEP